MFTTEVRDGAAEAAAALHARIAGHGATLLATLSGLVDSPFVAGDPCCAQAAKQYEEAARALADATTRLTETLKQDSGQVIGAIDGLYEADRGAANGFRAVNVHISV